ncbi:MAG: four helix bundle protein [Bacteroidales bacterium]|nr:four helix bundle protein [Bacteroidales bacterium]
MSYKDFTEMSVWQKAFKLLLRIYDLTKKFPKEEKYGIIDNTRRAANSVTNNIAEGFGRYEKYDKTRFYKISRGSAYEIVNQIMVSHALSYINNLENEELIKSYKEVIEELDMMIKSLETSDRKRTRY